MKHRSLFLSVAALLPLFAASMIHTSTTSQNTLNTFNVLNAGTLYRPRAFLLSKTRLVL